MDGFELNKIYHGNCLDVLKTFDDNSVDAVVTDPPYGLGFMGKEWDTFDRVQFGVAGLEGNNDLKVKKGFNVLPRYSTDGLYQFVCEWASECFRVLKPGGHLLAFAGTRTQHKICMGIEDAGFEIRDMIAWVYGSGFPKSLDFAKDNEESEKQGKRIAKKEFLGTGFEEGFGTALKPALEPSRPVLVKEGKHDIKITIRL